MEEINFVANRLGHDMRYALNSEKLANQMNRGLTVDLDAGLKKTVEWYKENKDWWLPLTI
jgi:dTDP-glucose 4,6-dehydratase